MFGPQGHHPKDLHGFTRHDDHGSGRPRGSTLRLAVTTVAAVGVLVTGCAGFAGFAGVATMRCHGVGYQTCFGLVIDDLTGKRAD